MKSTPANLEELEDFRSRAGRLAKELFTVQPRVEVFLEPPSVTIKGERKEETRTENKIVTYSEFRAGEVLSQILLPLEANPGTAKTAVKDRVLFTYLAIW